MHIENRPGPAVGKQARESGQPRVRKGLVITRKSVFLAGLGSGALIASQWRSVFKRGVKVAVKSSVTAQRIVARGAENIADLTREALADLHDAEVERGGKGGWPLSLTQQAQQAEEGESSADASAGTSS